MDDTPPAAAQRPCPICGKPARPQNHPFCSARCATIDLGRWLGGSYRIPGPEAPEGAETQPAEEDEGEA